MTQQTLFDSSPPVRRDHPLTSYQAASRIKVPAGTLRAKVYKYITNCGEYGATDEEIQDVLKMNPSTQRPRRIELVQLGLVRDSGKVRLTKSRRNAIVWVVKRDDA